MPWIRLYAIVEGKAELNFAKNLLAPHLAQFEIGLHPILLTTNRKLNTRGGVINYAKVKNDLDRRMRQDRDSDTRFTTMFDFYRLTNDFPGYADAQRCTTPQQKVVTLEAALQDDLPARRFIPYIQLHEFESLLYCDLTQLSQRIRGSERALSNLAKEVAGTAPEDINEGETTAPSKRIIRHVPLYEKLKVRVGAPAAAAIGLPTLRANCPHFDSWITQLEGLSGSM